MSVSNSRSNEEIITLLMAFQLICPAALIEICSSSNPSFKPRIYIYRQHNTKPWTDFLTSIHIDWLLSVSGGAIWITLDMDEYIKSLIPKEEGISYTTLSE